MPSDARGNGNQNGDDQELIRLLCRALSRLAVAATGIDRRLDEMLGDLRQLLRRDIDDSQHLSDLIDSIDARIKVVDDVRDQRGDLLGAAVESLIGQLLASKPPASVVRELKALQKEFKQKQADGEEFKLLARLPALQAQALDGRDDSARGGLLSRLFGRSEVAQAGESRTVAAGDEYAIDEVEVDQPIAVARKAAIAQVSPTHSTAPQTIAASDESVQREVEPPASVSPVHTSESTPDGEPPFARIASAVCHVLDHLLSQIEPPPTATENYRHACEQVAKGLNWYELVSTLEEIGVIVLAALERGQGEFQEFLLGISKRLEEAHQVIETSRQNQSQRQHDDDALNQAVRSEVMEIQVQVAAATQLESLKTTVGTRLDTIVGALDQHRVSSTQRQQELEQQLGSLTERLRDMEARSAAIEKRMIEQQRLALIDTLTQLPNRKAYDQRVVEECERWKRYKRPLTLAVCDVDHFKAINDQFGHLAGDKVLRIIAKTLRSRLRKADFIARFGGEEFVILLPETDRNEALRALDTLRDAVGQCPFHFRDKPVAVTVSIGIASFTAGSTLEAVFDRADSALYRAKEAGRNRCIVAAD
ncbi:MAG TPA: GGDEF domain-containing protein [Spongiibacteraceae bacterium]|nr:GGDEF domain-containing protein [Spongiibacteraceae bacterium]